MSEHITKHVPPAHIEPPPESPLPREIKQWGFFITGRTLAWLVTVLVLLAGNVYWYRCYAQEKESARSIIEFQRDENKRITEMYHNAWDQLTTCRRALGIH